MRLTDDERATIMEQLREEALADLKRAGCTCEPTMTQTESLHGPHQLPMWQSEHDDRVCALAQAMAVAGHDHSLMVGSSVSVSRWLP